MTRPLLLAALAVIPLPALADDLLDRYRAANIFKAEAISAFFLSRVPEMAPVWPEMGWDDEIAALAACILDGQRAARGEAGALSYVAAMEAWAPVPVTTMESMTLGMPAVLSDELAMQLTDTCGGVALSMARMQPVMDMMGQPGVLERLMAP